MNLQLQGKVALVTCASSGIGKACVVKMLEEGARVIAVSRSITQNDFKNINGAERLHLVQADMADGQQFETAIIGALSTLALEPEILIFLPIREPNLSILEVDEKIITDAIDHNLMRFLFLIKTLLPMMRAKGLGRIVTLLGASTLAPLSDHVPANVSRVAIASVLAGIAREYAVENICANNILLGVFDTPGIQRLWLQRAQNSCIPFEIFLQEKVSKIPLRRLGRPEECANLCALLVSPTLGYLNGQSILMDGGLNLNL